MVALVSLAVSVKLYARPFIEAWYAEDMWGSATYVVHHVLPELKRHPCDPELLNEVVEALETAHRIGDAAYFVDAAVLACPGTDERDHLARRLHARLDQTNDVLEDLDRLATRHPNDPTLRLWRANTANRAGDWLIAAVDYGRVLRAGYKVDDTVDALRVVYRRTGQWRALQQLDTWNLCRSRTDCIDAALPDPREPLQPAD